MGTFNEALDASHAMERNNPTLWKQENQLFADDLATVALRRLRRELLISSRLLDGICRKYAVGDTNDDA